MKIGIDISQVVYGTGVSVYTKNLVENLLKIDKENEFVLFGGSLRQFKVLKNQFSMKQRNLRMRYFRIPPSLADLIWNRLHVLRIERLVGKVDVWHSSDWTQPPSAAFKVTTVHDLAPMKYPAETDPKVVAVHRRRLEWVKREVDRIIAPSEATRRDLVEEGFDEVKIRVIAEGVERVFRPAKGQEVSEMKGKMRMNGDYLLAVGTGKRKNLDRIEKAFEILRAEGLVNQLVVVGRVKEGEEEKRGIRLTGFVCEKDLVRLFTGASALVYPTLYEGFGLPVLQAMACDCPVVTSNVSSLPEVAGNAAIFVDPYQVDEIVEGVKLAIKKRKELVDKGRKWVKRFSWEKMAKETLRVYEEGE